MIKKREIEILKHSDIENAYKTAREDFKGALLRFMDMQFLEEVLLSDAQRLTAEMLYLRFSVNATLFRDLQCETYQERLFFDAKNKEVYVPLIKLLSKSRACVPVFMRLMDAAYEKCCELRDVSAFPRNTDKRYAAKLLDITQDVVSVVYCVLPAWEVEKLYATGLFRLLKVKDDVGVIPDYSLVHSQLTEFAVKQAEEYLRIKGTISGPTYHEWKKHRPGCVACEYVICGLKTDVHKVLQNINCDVERW